MSYLSVGAIKFGGVGAPKPKRKVPPKPLFPFLGGTRKPSMGIMTAPGRPMAATAAPIVTSSVLTTSSLTSGTVASMPSISSATSKGGGGGGGGFATAEDPVMADLDEDEADTVDVSKKGGSGIILLALGAGVLYLLMKK